jgi:hypothetical protein
MFLTGSVRLNLTVVLRAIVYNHAVQLNCILFSKGQYACSAVKPEENTVIWQLTSLEEYEKTKGVLADRVVQGVGLRPLACGDCGFESHLGHRCQFCMLCFVG